jgi:predicted metal-dependent enzyme (double-stranded beta helix superfamily)
MILEKLISEITTNLQNNKELKTLSHILEKYDGIDWKKYIKFEEVKYTRNLIYKDDKIKILLICWNPNQKSGIHDHPNKGCLLKILEGNLSEVIYEKINKKFVVKTIKNLTTNNISYLEGKNGLHNITNGNDRSISLHIYFLYLNIYNLMSITFELDKFHFAFFPKYLCNISVTSFLSFFNILCCNDKVPSTDALYKASFV